MVNDVHLQDVAGPVQVLDEASRLGGGYRLTFCGASKRVRSAQGLVLADLEPLGEVSPGDLILVPGTCSSTLDRLDAPLDWLRDAAERGARLASVCSGAFVLGRCGLLDGRRCTTHWNLVDKLRAEHPRARVLENRLFVEDGNLITSAGVASGIDMAFYVVERLHGRAVADETARYIEYRRETPAALERA